MGTVLCLSVPRSLAGCVSTPLTGEGGIGIRKILQCLKVPVTFAHKVISDFKYNELEPCRFFVCFKESKFNLWHCWKATRAGKSLGLSHEH